MSERIVVDLTQYKGNPVHMPAAVAQKIRMETGNEYIAQQAQIDIESGLTYNDMVQKALGYVYQA